ncbi:MAG: hypothetical protein U1F35_13125 [Steroidobacteraceae bacterium]
MICTIWRAWEVGPWRVIQALAVSVCVDAGAAHAGAARAAAAVAVETSRQVKMIAAFDIETL